MEIEEGKVYKIIKTNGNEFVGFAYKPGTILTLLNKIVKNDMICLYPVRLSKIVTLDLIDKITNWGTFISRQEIKELVCLE